MPYFNFDLVIGEDFKNRGGMILEDSEIAIDTCQKCGAQPKFITRLLEPRSGRTYHMFQCDCGDKSWISEKRSEAAS